MRSASSDLSAQIKAAKAANPDSMIALSYPPDTFMLTEQSIANDFNPKLQFPRRRHGLPELQGQVRRQGQRHLRPRRLGSERPRHEGVLRAPQGREQGPGAGPLGQRRTPTPGCRCCSRRSSVSARSTVPRSCRRCKTGTFKTVQRRPEAPRQSRRQRLARRPVAGRRVLRHCAATGPAPSSRW